MELGFQGDFDMPKLNYATFVALQVANDDDPQTFLDCLELEGDLNLLGTMAEWAPGDQEDSGKRYDIYVCKDDSVLVSVDNTDCFRAFENIEGLQAWMCAHEPNATFGETVEE
jgi:hypothetical protein